VAPCLMAPSYSEAALLGRNKKRRQPPNLIRHRRRAAGASWARCWHSKSPENLTLRNQSVRIPLRRPDGGGGD
jgi:hypothetical protein